MQNFGGTNKEYYGILIVANGKHHYSRTKQCGAPLKRECLMCVGGWVVGGWIVGP